MNTRNDRMSMRRLAALFAFILAFALVIPGLTMTAKAEAKNVDVKITSFEIQNVKEEKVDQIFFGDMFRLVMDWDAKHLGMSIHEGDYFDITLPEAMRFPSEVTEMDFDVKDKTSGKVVGSGHVTPGAGSIGGTVRITFNKEVENKYNLHGSMWLGAKFEETKINKGVVNDFSVTVNGKATTASVTPLDHGDITNEDLLKWGKPVEGKPKIVRWGARINGAKKNYKNVVLSDELVGEGDETFVEGSFELWRVEFNTNGTIKQQLEKIDLTGKLDLSPDKKRFTIDLGDINGEQYSLHYQTSYNKAGSSLKNTLKLGSQDQETKQHVYTYRSVTSGGDATGDLASRIKLIKVDADDDTIVLKDAVFEVTKPGDPNFAPLELTTGEDGTVTSEPLEQGTYKVKEKKAPKGYEPSDEEFTLEVTRDGGAVQTITNKRLFFEAPVVKKWQDSNNKAGKRPDSVKVQLFANGKELGQPVVLNEANGWSHKWPGLILQENDADIVYSVKELDVPEGYESVVTGDAQNGFTVTNSFVEKNTEGGKKLAKTGFSGGGLALASLVLGGAGAAILVGRRRKHGQE